MSRIVAARFETERDADNAVGALERAGIPSDALAHFEVLPPGQHALHLPAGDALHDRGTRKSARGAAFGIAIGTFLGVFLGWVLVTAIAPEVPGATILGILAGAGAGAYVGSFLGAISRVRQPDLRNASIDEPVSRRAGPLVAVRADVPETFDRARDVFLDVNAFEIEEARGEIRGGDWVDFDPRLPPRIITPTRPSAAANVISEEHRR